MTPQRIDGSVIRQNVCQPGGTEGRRRLLLLVADLHQHRGDLAHHERQRDEDRGQHHARDGEDDPDAVVGEERPEPPVDAVDERERQDRR